MWDPNVGMGTVTHQNIGYLWPQGPWYWLFDHLGFPDWVAQRLWSGTLLFLAGLGVLFLLRTLGWRSSVSAGAARFAPAALPAALVYMLSPYVIEYIARISAILLPWAGPALAGRHRGAGPAVRPERPARRNRALAPPGAVRPGRHLHRCDQRHLADLRPDRAHPVDPVRGLVEPGGQAAPGPAVRRADDPAHLRGFAVVDGGAVHPGGLRAQRPAVQRDGQDGRWGVPGVRGAARSGQLVRLRRGRRRALDPGDEGLHGERAAAGADFRAAAARHARRGLRPLDSPGLLRHAHLRRHGDQRRRLPLRRPVPARRAVQGVPGGVDQRTGPALDPARGAAAGAGLRRAARGRGRRAAPAGCADRPARGGCRAGSPPPRTSWSSSSRSPMRRRCSAACSSTRT